MKRLLPILLAVLLLAGCGLFDPDPEDTLPDGTYSYSVNGGNQEENNDPLQPREKRVVKTVLSYAGEIPLTEPRETYSYQLPMIDLSGPQAVGINNELEERYGTLIRQSMAAMERYEEPLLQRLSFSTFIQSNILTLRVDRRDTDGSSYTAYFTVQAETGNAVSVSQLFEAVGLMEDPAALLNEAVTELFEQRYGSLEGADVARTTAMNRTQNGLVPLTANRMHLTENGRLIVAVELFAPDGGSSVVELTLP